jgi:hypothetical protein
MVDMQTILEGLAGTAAIILAVLAFGLDYARRKYGAWGDKIVAGIKMLRDGSVMLAQKFPTDEKLVKWSNDLSASYDDVNAAWASNDWLNWLNLIKASSDFHATYADLPAVIMDLVNRVCALPATPVPVPVVVAPEVLSSPGQPPAMASTASVTP